MRAALALAPSLSYFRFREFVLLDFHRQQPGTKVRPRVTWETRGKGRQPSGRVLGGAVIAVFLEFALAAFMPPVDPIVSKQLTKSPACLFYLGRKSCSGARVWFYASLPLLFTTNRRHEMGKYPYLIFLLVFPIVHINLNVIILFALASGLWLTIVGYIYFSYASIFPSFSLCPMNIQYY
jgi:hypothetical protein